MFCSGIKIFETDEILSITVRILLSRRMYIMLNLADTGPQVTKSRAL